MTIVRPSACSARRISQSESRVCGSRPTVGSSRKITRGSWISARAIMSRCCWPPDISSTFAVALSPMPSWSSSSCARVVAADVAIPKYAAWNSRFSIDVETAIRIRTLRHDADALAHLHGVAS